MTTYDIYKNMIIVSFDDSKTVIMSDSKLKIMFSFLLSDFLQYYLSLPVSAGRYYYYVYNMLEKIHSLSSSLTHQVIVDMLRNLFLVVHRFNYPEFRIIIHNQC